MKPATRIAVLFLVLVVIAHVLRLVSQVEVTVGSLAIPMWVSVLAVVGSGALAVWLWREQHESL